MAFNVNKCKLLRITYRKSSVIKYVYNMYQANALSYSYDTVMELSNNVLGADDIQIISANRVPSSRKHVYV